LQSWPSPSAFSGIPRPFLSPFFIDPQLQPPSPSALRRPPSFPSLLRRRQPTGRRRSGGRRGGCCAQGGDRGQRRCAAHLCTSAGRSAHLVPVARWPPPPPPPTPNPAVILK
jgi:hypothetical protein